MLNMPVHPLAKIERRRGLAWLRPIIALAMLAAGVAVIASVLKLLGDSGHTAASYAIRDMVSAIAPHWSSQPATGPVAFGLDDEMPADVQALIEALKNEPFGGGHAGARGVILPVGAITADQRRNALPMIPAP